jgi:hypothetical protein
VAPDAEAMPWRAAKHPIQNRKCCGSSSLRGYWIEGGRLRRFAWGRLMRKVRVARVVAVSRNGSRSSRVPPAPMGARLERYVALLSIMD